MTSGGVILGRQREKMKFHLLPTDLWQQKQKQGLNAAYAKF